MEAWWYKLGDPWEKVYTVSESTLVQLEQLHVRITNLTSWLHERTDQNLDVVLEELQEVTRQLQSELGSTLQNDNNNTNGSLGTSRASTGILAHCATLFNNPALMVNSNGFQDMNAHGFECADYAQRPGPVYSYNAFPSEPNALGVATENANAHGFECADMVQHPWPASLYDTLLCESNVPTNAMETHGHVNAAAIVEGYEILPLIERAALENISTLTDFVDAYALTIAPDTHAQENYALESVRGTQQEQEDAIVAGAEHATIAQHAPPVLHLETVLNDVLTGTPFHFIDDSVYNTCVDRANAPSSLIDTRPTAFIFLSHLDLADIPATPPLSRSPSPEYTPSSPVYIPSSPVLSSPLSPPSSACTCTREADCHAVRACNRPLPLPHSTLSVIHDPDTHLCRPMHPPGSHARRASPDSYDGDDDLLGLVSVSHGNDSSDSELDMDLEDDTDDDDNHLQSECEREDLMRERVEEILVEVMRNITEEVVEYVSPALSAHSFCD
ncbi:hypothetical protein SCP_0603020 [Sparassis crispa]|uniref:Uncharacterized protein n=1 Tax=Sparassis crispa TaxID=139825 RepID=A0A401GRH7_9APHY|nr:hypothetical protein SCP_0603020 [Sparassis crispa]GBE84324.1 hypothetical protein SCP_0603020 [Sparassis crispa]